MCRQMYNIHIGTKYVIFHSKKNGRSRLKVGKTRCNEVIITYQIGWKPPSPFSKVSEIMNLTWNLHRPKKVCLFSLHIRLVILIVTMVTHFLGRHETFDGPTNLTVRFQSHTILSFDLSIRIILSLGTIRGVVLQL